MQDGTIWKELAIVLLIVVTMSCFAATVAGQTPYGTIVDWGFVPETPTLPDSEACMSWCFHESEDDRTAVARPTLSS
ncbi:hypothetical protein ColTof3_11855 [Colletotrichum tofieldiae]|nr:hypothetical protein ColTof3_11855 [Colletotrichum tofieldiae]